MSVEGLVVPILIVIGNYSDRWAKPMTGGGFRLRIKPAMTIMCGRTK